MRKLLNSLYILDETCYLSLDGENIVCRKENDEKFRMPLANIEDIYCFSYLGCSPALMGKCADNGISISFFSPSGNYLASVHGKTKGNILLRKAQFEKLAEPQTEMMQNTVAAKLSNTRFLIRRSIHDNPEINADGELSRCIDYLESGIERVYDCNDRDGIMGIEGICAKDYFCIFDRLILQQKQDFILNSRTKRPPLDPVNAALSFLYTIMTSMFTSALESVGLDSSYGFYHALRPGRHSLACDLVEETRCIIERFVITLINLKKLTIKDFEKQENGAVWLSKDGKKKVLTAWQEKKRTTIKHPYLKENIPLGLLPFVQSSLLAKFFRGEISEYPCFLLK